MKEISGRELLKLIGRPDSQIIDVRPVDAYNGWQIEGEARGGHIRSARSLPARWADYIDWIEIVRHKGIHPENMIVLYGYDDPSILKVADRFSKAGFKYISIYRNFVHEWSATNMFPVERLPRYRNLVYPGWINQLLNGKNPPYYNNHRYVIVHAHYRNRQAYLSGHIPGAIDMDTLAIEEPVGWNRRTPHELKEALESHGITSDTTVILYGKFMFPDNRDPFPGSAAGDIGAMRCAFIMLYAGVKDVRILNGGFRSWEEKGLPVSTIDEPKKRATDFGEVIPAKPFLAIDTPQAKKFIEDPDKELVCVRSWSEYIGEVSGYNYIERKGRIPGAIFAKSGSDAYHMENYRNVDHTTREYGEIESFWNKYGITREKHLAFYCGTGWRGSEAFISAWLMGYPGISVYDGGWFEWSSDPGNPVETGVPIDHKEIMLK